MQGFNEFWAMYPVKVGRRGAARQWQYMTEHERAEALAALPKHKAQWEINGTAFIPHPTRWLTEGRWEDEIQATRHEVTAWWSTQDATLRKGSEIGLAPRPGEEMPQYRERITAALRARAA